MAEPRVALAILRGLAGRLRDLTEAAPALTAEPGDGAPMTGRSRCRAARSPSCSPTSRARPSSEGRIGRERYADARERHRQLLRDAWAAQRRRRAGHRGRFVLRRLPRGAARGRGGRRRPAGAGRANRGPTTPRSGSGWASTRGGAEASGDGNSLVGLAINRAARDRGGRPWRPDPGLRPDPGPARRRSGRRRSAARPGRAPAQDLGAPVRIFQVDGGRAALRVPAAPDARCPAQQPADPADDLHRPRRGARRGGRPCWPRPGC